MKIGNKELQVPIIQGGMGVGVSLGNLAGHVAKCGGLGVISSVNAGYKEPRFGADPKEANFLRSKMRLRRPKPLQMGMD